MTDEIIKTNFFTNYMEITNIGLNSDTILKLSQNSFLEILSVITSIALCIIPIYINSKLWKKNEELEKVNKFNYIINYFNIYIKEIYKNYSNIRYDNIGLKEKRELINKTILLYCRNIRAITNLLIMLKSDINNTYNNYFYKLQDIINYINEIKNKYIDFNNMEIMELFYSYFGNILYYCDTIILSINYEIYKKDISNNEDINSIYEEIEKIQEELNEILK